MLPDENQKLKLIKQISTIHNFLTENGKNTLPQSKWQTAYLCKLKEKFTVSKGTDKSKAFRKVTKLHM